MNRAFLVLCKAMFQHIQKMLNIQVLLQHDQNLPARFPSLICVESEECCLASNLDGQLPSTDSFVMPKHDY